MGELTDVKNIVVKVFNGYGHQQNLVVYGQVKRGPRKRTKTYTFSVLRNALSILKLYLVRPVEGARVRLQWNNQSMVTTTDVDGFFKFEWSSDESTPAGWHPVQVYLVDQRGTDTIRAEGKILVPHITQYGFISDIDDTVLISHSGSTGKKLTTLLTTDPLKRKAFSDVVRFYQLLSLSHTGEDVPNPFFYVSSSEWNLYDYLSDFFSSNNFPEGIFLLSDFKRVAEIVRVGNTKHRGKGDRIRRILEVYPNQRFILLGDNTQKDPVIYSEICNEFPGRIAGIYLRIVNEKKKVKTLSILDSIVDKDIPIHLFKETSEAIDQAMKSGLMKTAS